MRRRWLDSGLVRIGMRRVTRGRLSAAIARAKHIVDAFLVQEYKKGMTAEELYGQCTTFGEDPFIVGGPPPSTFSAWDHARKRCDEICSGDRPF